MVEFKCPRCRHIFDRRTRLEVHYRRTNICRPENLDIPIEILRETVKETDDNVLLAILQATDLDLYQKYKDYLFKNLCPNGQKNTPAIHRQYTGDTPATNLAQGHVIIAENNIAMENLGVNGKNKHRLYCKYCQKLFSSINARCRHENHRCENKELIENTLEKYTNPIENMLLTGDCSIENINSNNKIINNINNNTHNYTFNITNNIQQNVFGQENFDYIKNDKKIEAHLEKLADTNTKRFFIELFRLAFFSNKHPENKTFALENAKSLCIKILKELPNKWEYASKSEIFYKKIIQILSWIVDETNIVTEGTITDKQIDQVFREQKPTINEVKKIFETMEVFYYKNKKLEDERQMALLLNLSNKKEIKS